MNDTQMVISNVKGAKRYSFNDDKTGRLVEGVNVFFERAAKNDDEVGTLTEKVTLPITAWGTISRMTFPSNCEATVTQELGSRGIRSKITALKPILK